MLTAHLIPTWRIKRIKAEVEGEGGTLHVKRYCCTLCHVPSKCNSGIRSFHLLELTSRSVTIAVVASSKDTSVEPFDTLNLKIEFAPSTLCVDVMPSVRVAGWKQKAHLSRFLRRLLNGNRRI